MDRRRRWSSSASSCPGLLLLLATYFFVTAFEYPRQLHGRDFGELDYQYEQNKSIVTRSELWVSLGVAAASATIYFVRDNRRGLTAVFAVMTCGVLLLGGATWLHAEGASSKLVGELLSSASARISLTSALARPLRTADRIYPRGRHRRLCDLRRRLAGLVGAVSMLL